MKAKTEFIGLPIAFWANVRFISQELGYTNPKTSTNPASIKVPSQGDIYNLFAKKGLDISLIQDEKGIITDFSDDLISYFVARKEILEGHVAPNLMKANEAEQYFNNLRERLNPNCPLPLNKQSGDKKTYAFFTGIINMLIEDTLGKEMNCDFDPRSLLTLERRGRLVHTLSRRMDGAFPGTHNPIAIWEIKEYYYTTTFGSRIADGVYETQLDGYELLTAQERYDIEVLHYLMIDAYETWWGMGKSYLCRIIDMLHMGLLTEVLFGREVLTRLPEIIREDWLKK